MYGWIQLPILPAAAARQEAELEQKQVNEGGSGKSKSGEGFIKHLTPRPTPIASLLLQSFLSIG